MNLQKLKEESQKLKLPESSVYIMKVLGAQIAALTKKMDQDTDLSATDWESTVKAIK